MNLFESIPELVHKASLMVNIDRKDTYRVDIQNIYVWERRRYQFCCLSLDCHQLQEFLQKIQNPPCLSFFLVLLFCFIVFFFSIKKNKT